MGLCRSAPIFGLTGLDDSEFDLDNVSDDLNSDMSEDPRRGSERRNEEARIKYFYRDEEEQKALRKQKRKEEKYEKKKQEILEGLRQATEGKPLSRWAEEEDDEDAEAEAL